MCRRFNDTAIKLIEKCSLIENYSTLPNASEKLIEQLCDYLSLSEYNKDYTILDFKFFKFVAINKKEIDGNPISELLEANIGYQHLRQISESVLCIPIATATVERSFGAMNRIISKLRNRMGQYTLGYCIKIIIEGEEDPPQEFIEEVIDLYARKKLAALD